MVWNYIAMSATEVDNNPGHLYPEFRKKLEKVLSDAATITGHKWVISEGYRSQARQSWLYASGRTRPGPVVTWLKTPTHHGKGLAADCYPSTDGHNPNFSLPHSNYEALRKIYLSHGLENPAWKKGDYGHIQWPAKDAATHAKADAWCKAGFPGEPTQPAVPVYVHNALVSDAEAYHGEGGVWVALRPVAQALGWSVTASNGHATLTHPGDATTSIDYEQRGDTGFVPVRELGKKLGVGVAWREPPGEVRVG